MLECLVVFLATTNFWCYAVYGSLLTGLVILTLSILLLSAL